MILKILSDSRQDSVTQISLRKQSMKVVLELWLVHNRTFQTLALKQQIRQRWMVFVATVSNRNEFCHCQKIICLFFVNGEQFKDLLFWVKVIKILRGRTHCTGKLNGQKSSPLKRIYWCLWVLNSRTLWAHHQWIQKHFSYN